MRQGPRATFRPPSNVGRTPFPPGAAAEDRYERRSRRFTYGVISALVALATLAVWLWGRSPSARYMHHDGAGEGDSAVLAFGLFVLGWSLMTVAMMLPSALPLVRAFSRLTRRRAHRHGLQVLMVGTFLVLWVLFGVAVLRADLLLHALVEDTGWLRERPQLILAIVLVSAGAYQLSSVRYRCLSRCQSPAGFVIRHWTSDHPYLAAARIGGAYGLFCLACCWPLMLLMFAMGSTNLAVMLMLGGFMAAEKNLPRARPLMAPLGPLLIAVGGGLTIVGVMR